MTNTLIVSAAFKRDAKKLLKKYATLQRSVDSLIAELIKNPFLGKPYVPDIYKIRLADPSKGKGKSGGFSVMYFHLSKTDTGIEILLMSIYDKSERSTVTKSETLKKLNDIFLEDQQR